MITIGRLTIYNLGEKNVTHIWGNLYLGKHKFLCFYFPTITGWRNKQKKRYLMLSPNGTPWACTWYWGSSKQEAIRARIRRLNFGLVFNPSSEGGEYEKLYSLNNKFYSLYVSEYDVSQYGTHTLKED